VALTDVQDTLAVFAAWNGTPEVPGDAIAAPDPRLPEAGWRVLSPRALPETADAAAWDMHRLALGLPDGSRDLEAEKTVRYIVPVGAPYGTLNFTVSDANYSNLLDYQQLASTVLKSPTQVISFLNELRPNTNAYVRVWRTDPAYQVQGEDMPDPPPSLGLILAKAQAAQGAWFARGSKIDELLIETGNVVVTGSKNVSVEVKE